MGITESTKARALEIAGRVADQQAKQDEINKQAEEAKRADMAYAQEIYASLQEAGHNDKVIERTLHKMGIDYGIIEFLMTKPLEYPHHQMGQQLRPPQIAGPGVGGYMPPPGLQGEPNTQVTQDAPPTPEVSEQAPPTEEAPPTQEQDA